MSRRSSLIAWFVAWWLMLSASVAFASVVPVSSTETGVPLGAHIEFLEDVAGHLDLAAVVKLTPTMRPNERPAPNFGYTRSVYWFHLRVRNDERDATRRLFEAQYPMLDDAQFFVLRDGAMVSSLRAGRLFPFSAREVEHRNLIVPVDLLAGETLDLYVRVRTDSSMQLPLVQFSTDSLRARDQGAHLALGAYYGVMVAMLLFNLLAFVQIRDRSYVHYLHYLSAYIAFQFLLNGFAFEYVLPDLPRVARSALPISICVALVGMLNFSRSFLDLSVQMPKADRVMRGYVAVLVVLAFASIVAPYSLVIQVATVNALVVSITVFVVSLVCLARGQKQARYFMVAWAAPLFGLALYPLKSFGLLPTTFVTEYGLQIGSALEALLLSVALLDRLKVLKEQTERNQSEANRDLEQRVQQRTQELNDALHDLSDANEVLQRLNVMDGLTGIKNRKHFDTRLADELKAVSRTGLPLSLLLIDVDHFKAVNDVHGHLAGDACLKEVAQAVDGALYRPGDEAARYGGEEFAVLLPQTAMAGAVAIGDRVRAAVEALQVDFDGTRIPLTVSVGVSAVTTDDGGANPLIAAADAALYRAKGDGRNRVRAASLD